jgi:hypothetical protein
MNNFRKYLTGAMHRAYDSVVQRPMPWRMIDTLTSLEEAEEARLRDIRDRDSTHGDHTDGAGAQDEAQRPPKSMGRGV